MALTLPFRAAAVVALTLSAPWQTAAQEIVFQDDFAATEVGQRPAGGYRFIGFPLDGELTDGVIAHEGERAYLQFSRLSPDENLPSPAVVREFARQSLDADRSLHFQFKLRQDEATGSTIQFNFKNANTGQEGAGQAIYFKPEEGLWVYDAQGIRHFVYQGPLEVGRWYRIELRIELPERKAVAALYDTVSDEVIGETPVFDMNGRQASYLDQLVIARAEAPVTYRYGFTGFALIHP